MGIKIHPKYHKGVKFKINPIVIIIKLILFNIILRMSLLGATNERDKNISFVNN